jgi:hypothetical protein
MRSLRYSINVTVDGCRDRRAGIPDADDHWFAPRFDRGSVADLIE